MKTLILLIVPLLASCSSLPLVSDKDAQGNPQVPVCPKCGERFGTSATLYRDKNGHFGVSTKWHGELGADTSPLRTTKLR